MLFKLCLSSDSCIRLRQVAFEVVQYNCAFANCTTFAFEIDDAELLLLFSHSESFTCFDVISSLFSLSSDRVGVGLHICLDNMVLSSMCLGLFRTTKLCLSSDSVGVGLQMHLDNKVVSRMGLNSVCCLSCACHVTVLELVC